MWLYLHPCSCSRSSWVHCLDVARSSSSDHKAPAHCIPHNLQAEQKGFKSQGMGWVEEMQQFPVRWRALLMTLICYGWEKKGCAPNEMQNSRLIALCNAVFWLIFPVSKCRRVKQHASWSARHAPRACREHFQSTHTLPLLWHRRAFPGWK